MSLLPVNVKGEVYFKTIIAAVTYAITVWSACPLALFHDLENINVIAAQSIHGIPCYADKMESMDNLHQIYKNKILSVMYKLQHKVITDATHNLFKERLFQSQDRPVLL